MDYFACAGVTTLTLIPLSSSSSTDQNTSMTSSSSSSSSSSSAAAAQQHMALQSTHKSNLVAVSERTLNLLTLIFAQGARLDDKWRMQRGLGEGSNFY